MLINNQQIMEEIKKEIKICTETYENENMTIQNLWDSVRSSAKGDVHSNARYLKKQEKNQINHLILHLK